MIKDLWEQHQVWLLKPFSISAQKEPDCCSNPLEPQVDSWANSLKQYRKHPREKCLPSNQGQRRSPPKSIKSCMTLQWNLWYLLWDPLISSMIMTLIPMVCFTIWELTDIRDRGRTLTLLDKFNALLPLLGMGRLKTLSGDILSIVEHWMSPTLSLE